mmetsp:Transcript_874/g.1812  ORF Transcript_874/g.1812 Transcript_874/m.1812 type:complete len:1046 (-) Transcript_874:193-3330(-)|eukprot:CAMPEP_0114231840 /NCGR_PEP_ID=MMETSP0058-20121206/4274_1 /TAXON_ID=36894 /ORGANISM="Pyramimonas parkeae, CCMP726" /LENGTH=1045 /DNA_ID=CAMNT_0001343247 /DNA_START=387 /DNA_END=3524 /DNA_ORIENTATION=+
MDEDRLKNTLHTLFSREVDDVTITAVLSNHRTLGTTRQLEKSIEELMRLQQLKLQQAQPQLTEGDFLEYPVAGPLYAAPSLSPRNYQERSFPKESHNGNNPPAQVQEFIGRPIQPPRPPMEAESSTVPLSTFKFPSPGLATRTRVTPGTPFQRAHYEAQLRQQLEHHPDGGGHVSAASRPLSSNQFQAQANRRAGGEPKSGARANMRTQFHTSNLTDAAPSRGFDSFADGGAAITDDERVRMWELSLEEKERQLKLKEARIARLEQRAAEQARRDEESDFFSPLRSLDGANTIWELDRGGEEGSITPAKIVDWISDTLWGGEPSDDDDRLEMPSCPPWGVVDEAQLESTSVCQRLLLGLLPEAQPAVELAESLARDFNQEYDLWAAAATSEGQLNKWRDRVAGMCMLVMKSLLAAGGRMRYVHRSYAWTEQLHTMVEAYLFSLVSAKLFSGVQRICSAEDAELSHCLFKYRNIDPNVVGVRPEHRDVIVGAALQRFRELPTLVTPLAKAACLRDTVQLIFVAIQQLSESSVEGLAEAEAPATMPRWVQEGTDPLGLAKNVPNRGDVSAVRVGGDAALAAQMAAATTTTTNYSNSNGINSAPDKDVSKKIKKKKHADDLLPCADDLLSIVVLLVTRANVYSLAANATFMDHFLSLQTPFQHKGELGYVLANFMAAVEYLKSDDLSERVLAQMGIPLSDMAIATKPVPADPRPSASPEAPNAHCKSTPSTPLWCPLPRSELIPEGDDDEADEPAFFSPQRAGKPRSGFHPQSAGWTLRRTGSLSDKKADTAFFADQDLRAPANRNPFDSAEASPSLSRADSGLAEHLGKQGGEHAGVVDVAVTSVPSGPVRRSASEGDALVGASDEPRPPPGSVPGVEGGRSQALGDSEEEMVFQSWRFAHLHLAEETNSSIVKPFIAPRSSQSALHSHPLSPRKARAEDDAKRPPWEEGEPARAEEAADVTRAPELLNGHACVVRVTPMPMAESVVSPLLEGLTDLPVPSPVKSASKHPGSKRESGAIKGAKSDIRDVELDIEEDLHSTMRSENIV